MSAPLGADPLGTTAGPKPAQQVVLRGGKSSDAMGLGLFLGGELTLSLIGSIRAIASPLPHFEAIGNPWQCCSATKAST